MNSFQLPKTPKFVSVYCLSINACTPTLESLFYKSSIWKLTTDRLTYKIAALLAYHHMKMKKPEVHFAIKKNKCKTSCLTFIFYQKYFYDKIHSKIFYFHVISSVIRQKGFVGNKANHKTEVTRKQSAPNFPRNKHFVGKKCSFSENLACLAFLLPPFWDCPFALLPTNCSVTATICITKSEVLLVVDDFLYSFWLSWWYNVFTA